MIRCLALIALFLCTAGWSQDSVRTWRFFEYGNNTSIPDEQWRQGVREAFDMYERYFEYDFVEVPGNRQDLNYYVGFWNQSPLVGYGLAVADRLGQWYWRKNGVIYVDPNRNLVSQDQVRVLIAHELGHMFSGAAHSADPRDIMHIDVRANIPNFTVNDFNRMARWMRPRPNIRPWTDPNPPWLAPAVEYDWHNPNEGFQHDTNGDGRHTWDDVYEFLGALQYPTLDRSKQPAGYWDVDDNGVVDEVDVRRVIRWLKDFN